MFLTYYCRLAVPLIARPFFYMVLWKQILPGTESKCP